MLTKVQKWENGQGLQFAKAILEEAQINVGDEVNVSVQKGRIIVEPVTSMRGHYDLKTWVSQMPEGVPIRGDRLGTTHGKGSVVDDQICSRERGFRNSNL